MDKESIRETFPKRYKYYMEIRGKSRGDIVRDLGYRYTTIRDWETGTTIPRMDKVEALASYFGCTTSDLLDAKNEPAIADELSKTKKDLINIVENMSESEAAVLLASLRSALERL